MNDPSKIPDDPFDSVGFYNAPKTPSESAKADAKPPPKAYEEDDEDYELEAPDEDVVQTAERRAREDVARAQAVIDIDEIYREENADPDWEEMFKGFRFRYQTKHLLILTAVVSVIMAAITLSNFMVVLILGTLACLAGAHIYLAWREHQRQQRLEDRRKQIYERARLIREGKSVTELPPLIPVDEPPSPALETEPFRFDFTRNEWLAAAGIALVLGSIFAFASSGGALLLGLVALTGLVIFAIGYDAPRIVVLGWWLTLVMYLVMSVLVGMSGSP